MGRRNSVKDVFAMSHFYVTLPSNSSSEYYPNNTVARYTAKLVNKIELEGDWEVGLAEASMPSMVDNVVQGRCFYDMYFADVTTCRAVLPPANHKYMDALVEVLHEAQQKVMEITPLPVVFSYRNRKISLQIADDVKVKFSADLALILGLDEDLKYSGTTARYSTTLDAPDVHSVYVYCDVLEHVAVGDTRAPLLRIVDKSKKKNENVHKVMNPILYVPLQKKNFDTVEINMMTDSGIPVPFSSGKAFVVLEFCRSLHSYFGL